VERRRQRLSKKQGKFLYRTCASWKTSSTLKRISVRKYLKIRKSTRRPEIFCNRWPASLATDPSSLSPLAGGPLLGERSRENTSSSRARGEVQKIYRVARRLRKNLVCRVGTSCIIDNRYVLFIPNAPSRSHAKLFFSFFRTWRAKRATIPSESPDEKYESLSAGKSGKSETGYATPLRVLGELKFFFLAELIMIT
jgi:hypothetical protein